MSAWWRWLIFMAADLGWPTTGALVLLWLQLIAGFTGHPLPVWLSWCATAVVLVALFASYRRVRARHRERERIWDLTQARRRTGR